MKGYHKIIDKYNKNQLIEMVEYIIDGNEEAKLTFWSIVKAMPLKDPGAWLLKTRLNCIGKALR